MTATELFALVGAAAIGTLGGKLIARIVRCVRKHRSDRDYCTQNEMDERLRHWVTPPINDDEPRELLAEMRKRAEATVAELQECTELCAEARSGEAQLDKLATYIMDEMPGEPSQSQGAGDTAIRLLQQHRELMAEAERVLELARHYVDCYHLFYPTSGAKFVRDDIDTWLRRCRNISSGQGKS